MPKVEKNFDLKKLKEDPSLWARLATPGDDKNVLKGVFDGQDNPFERDPEGAMKKIKHLASEGKLYVREYGRASHYHKVNMNGKQLETEGSYKQVIGNPDMAGGLLMRLSRAYFKWIGFDSIANWFDKRLEKRAERIKKNKEYKAKYKKLSKEEKKELKRQEKQEKALEKAKKKLADLEKATLKAKNEVNQLLSKMGKKVLGEMDSLLSQPPDPEKDKNSLQPNLLGDDEQKQREKTSPEQEKTPVNNDKEKEPTEEKKEKETPKLDSDVEITINGKTYTRENLHEAPEDVQKLISALDSLAKEMQKMESERKEKAPQTEEKTKEQTEEPLIDEEESLLIEDDEDSVLIEDDEDSVLIEDDKDSVLIEDDAESLIEEETPGKTEDFLDLKSFPLTNDVQFADVSEFEFDEPAEKVNKTENAPLTNDVQFADVSEFEFDEPTEKVNKTEMEAPLNQPAKIEKDKVGAQNRPKEQTTSNLKDQLFQEEQRMNAVRNWKNFLEDALFAHESKELRQNRHNMLENPKVGDEFLSCVTFGILTKKGLNSENKQQVMDTLLDGKSIGHLNPELIRDGTSNYSNVLKDMAFNNKKPMEELLTNAVKELSQQVSRETELSPRTVMIGRLISNAMLLAENNKIKLPLNEKETAMAQGAVTMARIAQNHHNARQYLGKEPMDITSERGRGAVRDLLTGNAMEQMILKDKSAGEFVTNTQLLMGKGIWSEDNLSQMTTHVLMKNDINQAQVGKILNDPKAVPAQKAATRIMDGIVSETLEQQNIQKQVVQRNMHNVRNMENPAMNSL